MYDVNTMRILFRFSQIPITVYTSEWKKLDIRQAREYYKVLNNHVRYLEAALTMYDLWHEKEKTEEMKRAKEAPPKKIEGNS